MEFSLIYRQWISSLASALDFKVEGVKVTIQQYARRCARLSASYIAGQTQVCSEGPSHQGSSVLWQSAPQNRKRIKKKWGTMNEKLWI